MIPDLSATAVATMVVAQLVSMLLRLCTVALDLAGRPVLRAPLASLASAARLVAVAVGAYAVLTSDLWTLALFVIAECACELAAGAAQRRAAR